MTQKTRILSMDGGPSGITYLNVLLEIEREKPGFLTSTDVFVGTSFGALSALYLAKFVDSGQSGTEIIAGCIDFVQEAFDLSPTWDNWINLIVGKSPMYDNASIAKVLAQTLGPDTTMGELSRRVMIVVAGSVDPTGSTVYDSNTDPDANVSEVGLESSAAPILLPLPDGRVDGGLASNSPSMDAVSQLLSGSSRLRREDLVLLSVGGDGGSSALSNLSVPSTEDLTKEQRLAVLDTPEDAPDEVVALLEEGRKVVELWDDIERQLLDDNFTIPRIGRPFVTGKDLFDDPPVPTSPNVQWGWRAWLLYFQNPLFFVQSLLNNQASAAARQANLLLGDRALRLAPMALLDTNQLFLLFFFFGPNPVLDLSAQVTAGLWDNPFSSLLFEFEPNSPMTYDWIDDHWM